MNFHTELWAWPQWTEAASMAISLLVFAAMHGKTRKVEYSFPIKLCAVAASVWILTAGGFFK